ncbi:MAG: molybdenum cofactor guanylyltransferase [Cyanobacteria bacterium P01_C01_bin.118]
MFHLAALVLAGGQSQRMGRDKALLSMPLAYQSTLLQQVCHVAQGCSPDLYVLTPWPENYQPLLPPIVTLLHEPTVGHGPLVALEQGWAQILATRQQQRLPPPDWLLTLACDMPGLELTTLQRWRQTLINVDAGAIAALPKQSERWEPLCGFYHRRCLPSLKVAINNNVRSFQRWLHQENVVQLLGADSHMLRNCNTPAEWQQFLTNVNARNPD